MLAWIRPFLFLVILLLLLSSLPLVEAQVHGVPASVTSFGFGGNFSPAPGVPASVTSLGPFGYGGRPAFFGNCCFGPMFGAHVHQPIFTGHQFHGHRASFSGGWPYYSVPYTQVVVVQPEVAGDEEDEYYGGPTIFDRRGSGSTPVKLYLASEPEKATAPQPATAVPAPPPEPIAAQPSTLLIYRDGHQSEVVNYAIVDGVLFEFLDGRTRKIQLADLDLPATRKANDERGVDFQVPIAR